MTGTTISFIRDGMTLIQEAAKRPGCSVSQFIREAALMRAVVAAHDNPYPIRTLAAQLRAIGDQGRRVRGVCERDYVADEVTRRRRGRGDEDWVSDDAA